MTRATTTLAALAVTVVAASGVAALECFDYTETFQQLGETPIAQDLPRELCVIGDAAYSVGVGTAFVGVYDLSDPANPRELDPLPLPAEPTAIAANAWWLLVTVPELGLVRYDLSDPFAPVADDTLDLGTELPDVALRGDLAAVSTVGGVRVIGLDYPFGMLALGTYATPSAVEALAVDGNRLYLATFGHGLWVLDASDPGSLQPVGSSGFQGTPEQVAADEGIAVVVGRQADGVGGQATAYDIVGDGSPPPLASMAFDLGVHGRAIPRVTGQDRVVITMAGTGVSEYRIADQQFVLMGFLPGRHADIHFGLTRYDLLSESRLRAGEPGLFPPPSIEITGAGQLAATHDDYIFSADNFTLRVVQVDAPFGPEHIGSGGLFPPFGPRLSIAVLDPALYVGTDEQTFQIVDLLNLRIPELVGSRSVPTDPTGMVIADQTLVVLMQDWGLATFDLGDVLDPQLIATFPADIGVHRGAEVMGDQLLVGTASGVDVYDVSNPAAVVLMDNLPDRYYISDLAVAGDRLLVTDRVQSTQVWRRTAGTGDWNLLGTIPATRQVSAAVGGEVGYLLGEFGEVSTLDLRGEGVPPIVATLPTSFVYNTYLIAGDAWLDLPRGPNHRLYPPPCLGITTVETVPPVAGLALAAAPNPFNPRTRLSFTLERGGEATLRIYDLRGRPVATLLDGLRPAGRHQVDWHGIDERGRPLPSGVYHARLTAAGATVSRKVTLLK